MCRCVSFRNGWSWRLEKVISPAAGAPPRGGRAFDPGRSRPCGAAGSRPSAQRAPPCRGNRVCGVQGGPLPTPLTSSREGACHELSAVAQDTLAEGHCCHPPSPSAGVLCGRCCDSGLQGCPLHGSLSRPRTEGGGASRCKSETRRQPTKFSLSQAL